MANFPQQLKELLSTYHTVLDPELRMVRPRLGPTPPSVPAESLLFACQ